RSVWTSPASCRSAGAWPPPWTTTPRPGCRSTRRPAAEMRVHFWTADNGGSAMYRGHLPALGLSWLGHRPSVGTVLPSEEDGTPKLDGLDVVVGCRVAKAGPLKMWQQLKDRGVRLVYDLDDDYLHTDPA